MEAGSLIPIITFLVVVGVLVTFGARYARHKGHLQSRTAKLTPVIVVGILALALWVGPMLFLATDGSPQ